MDGERLYKRAHRGESQAERPERDVEVYRADLLSHEGDRAAFEIECSAGTYVRTLIEELGDAYCEELRRTAVGHLRLEDAGEPVRPVEELVSYLPERALDADQAEQVIHGIKLPKQPGDPGPDGGPIRLTSGGRLLAIARPRDQLLKTEVVLA